MIVIYVYTAYILITPLLIPYCYTISKPGNQLIQLFFPLKYLYLYL